MNLFLFLLTFFAIGLAGQRRVGHSPPLQPKTRGFEQAREPLKAPALTK